jgi:hypothetical protein
VTGTRRLAFLLIVAAAALLDAGCGYPHPHACDNHGGIHTYVKAIYYCRDGTTVGNGWLWLHHESEAP